MRIQFTIDDEVKETLDRLSKERGVTPAVFITMLIRNAEGQNGAGQAGGESGFGTTMVMQIVTTRMDQLQSEIDAERAARMHAEKQTHDLRQRLEQAEQDTRQMRESMQYLTAQLEPLVGISLRPGVVYNPAPVPTRRWWQWR
jgi:hypothetical protein